MFAEHEALILRLRRERSLGHRRLANELKRNHDQTYSLATLHKVLQKNAVKLLGKRSIHKTVIRYNRLIPGERFKWTRAKLPLAYINTQQLMIARAGVCCGFILGARQKILVTFWIA